MERNKQIQIALVGVLALMLIGFFATGAFKGLMGNSEGEQIRDAASSVNANVADMGGASSLGSQKSDNIPGTNSNVQPAPSGPTTTIEYDSERYEFGIVDEGEIVKHVFKFTNTGDVPLLVNNAKGSCGCTVPTWPKEPVAPGATGELNVEFNTRGKPGKQIKRVTVTANTVPTETFIEVAGEVRGKDSPAVKGE